MRSDDWVIQLEKLLALLDQVEDLDRLEDILETKADVHYQGEHEQYDLWECLNIMVHRRRTKL